MCTPFLSIGMVTAGAGSVSAQAASSGSAFAAQAKALGLTTADAKSLQARADYYLAKVGGTQVGINKIQLSGAQILLTLPGEQVARELDAPIGIQGACPFLHFCAYRWENYVGDSFQQTQIDMYYCQFYGMPWGGRGSWRNNQTQGTKAKFYNKYYGYLTQTLGAYTETSSFDWTPVWYVKPCGG